MSQFSKIVLPIACLLSTNLAYADSTNFKRWAVSAGWMHVMPQGKANSTHVTTAVEEGGSYGVGSLWGADLEKYATNSKDLTGMGKIMFDSFVKNSKKDPEYKVPNSLMNGARSDISGISDYTAAGGMEAENTDTLGLTLSYFVNDNVSLELIGGIPPKVDIKGVGEIRAVALSTSNSPPPLGTPPTYFNGLQLLKDTLITDLGAHGKVAEVTAWTPAITAKYHFGTSGTVTDTSTGRELIKSTTKIDLDPLVTYVGVGYRF